jgi:hypothetical protein
MMNEKSSVAEHDTKLIQFDRDLLRTKGESQFMKNMLLFAVVLGAVGIVFGYLIFGKVLGQYVDIVKLISPDKNVFEQLGNSIMGIRTIRTDILLCGLGGVIGGAVIGLLVTITRKSR